MKEIHGHTIEDVIGKILPDLVEPTGGSERAFIEWFEHMKYNRSHAESKLSSFVRRFFNTDERVQPIRSSREALERDDLNLLLRYAALGKYFSGFHDHTLGSDLTFLPQEYDSHLDAHDSRQLSKRDYFSDEKKSELLKSGKYVKFPESAFRLGEKTRFQGYILSSIYFHYICRELTDWSIYSKNPNIIPDAHSVKQTNEFLTLGKLMESYINLIKHALVDQIDMVGMLEKAPWSPKEGKDRLDFIKDIFGSMMEYREFIMNLVSDEKSLTSNIYDAALQTVKLLLKRKEFQWSIGPDLEKFIEQIPRDLEMNLSNQDMTAAFLSLIYDYNESVTKHNYGLYTAFRREHRIRKFDSLPDKLWKKYKREKGPLEYHFDINFDFSDDKLTLKFRDYHPSNALINNITAKILQDAGCKLQESDKDLSIEMPVKAGRTSYDILDSKVGEASQIQELYSDTEAAHKEKSILLVEDDERFLVPMIGWMQSLGIGKIYTAQNLSDAEKIYNANDLDALVLDINLPKSKGGEVKRNLGFELAEKITDIPIIYSTAASNDIISSKARNMPYSDSNIIERKPFKIVEKGLSKQCIDAVSELVDITKEQPKQAAIESTFNQDYLGKNILIVEDQDNFLSTLENILIGMGIPQAQIYKTKNGKEAVKYLEKNPDTALTITDLRMPKMDGMQFLAIYSSTFKDQKPIIVVTGSYSNEEAASLLQDESLDKLDLNLRYTIKGNFFSDNIRKLVDKALTEPDELSEVEIQMPESLEDLPRVHTLNHLEELAVQRRGELYVLETNKEELLRLVGDKKTITNLDEIQTEFTPPGSLDLTDQHDYKTEIAAVLVGNQENIRKIEATIKSQYEQKHIPRSNYGKILSHLSLIEQATENAYKYTVQIVRNLAEVDKSAFSEVDLNDCIQNKILKEFQEKYKNVKFIYEPSQLPKLKTSEKALADSLKAIIDNAATYGREVRVKTTTENDTVYIRVTDNGPGVPESIKDRIFDPLYTTRVDKGGTGVGLSLAYNNITRLGGDLKNLPLDKGACFEVQLKKAA